MVKLILVFSVFISINSNTDNNEEEDESLLNTITKPLFIEYYNKFFVENNPLPEISELYKENPDYFKLLAAKLVETLPERFPLKMVQDIFDKDRIMKAVEEMKTRNLTVDQYNEEKRKNIEEDLRQKELEKLKKREELEKQKNRQKKETEAGSFGILIYIK
jgi:predicted phosphohydrolase